MLYHCFLLSFIICPIKKSIIQNSVLKSFYKTFAYKKSITKNGVVNQLLIHFNTSKHTMSKHCQFATNWQRQKCVQYLAWIPASIHMAGLFPHPPLQTLEKVLLLNPKRLLKLRKALFECRLCLFRCIELRFIITGGHTIFGEIDKTFSTV